MDLESLIAAAASNGASDLHLESGLPAAVRIRGSLRTSGDPIPAKDLYEAAHSIIGEEQWTEFV
jgi:twitching motility protein PilT